MQKRYHGNFKDKRSTLKTASDPTAREYPAKQFAKTVKTKIDKRRLNDKLLARNQDFIDTYVAG